METEYKNLTGVDISEQKSLWDERGKGYYGEYLVFSELYPHVVGNCKILMNLEIPSANGKKTEIDLILIHETGLYVFEVKHYKGTIYGSADNQKWTQYFRTAPNQHFYNPVLQNKYHIDALEKLFPGVPMHSYVVFTNPECDLRINPMPEDISVCKLWSLSSNIALRFGENPSVFDIAMIDSVFCELAQYSPMCTDDAVVDGNVVPLAGYVQQLREDYQQHIKTKDADTAQRIKKVNRRAIAVTLCSLASCLAFAVFTVTGAEQRIIAAETKLAEFAQKFEHVDSLNNGNITVSENLIAVSEVVLEPSVDITNAVNFSCLLTSTSENYGVGIGEDAAIIVILKDGSVKEYDLWNHVYPYRMAVHLIMNDMIWSETARIGVHEFYDIDVSDISYIKLANLEVCPKGYQNRESIVTGYEIELYANK